MEYQLHGGDIYHGKIALDFSVNVNPLGLPCGVQIRWSIGIAIPIRNAGS